MQAKDLEFRGNHSRARAIVTTPSGAEEFDNMAGDCPSVRDARRILGVIVEVEAAEMHRALLRKHHYEYSLDVRQRLERGRLVDGADPTHVYTGRQRLLVEHRRVLAEFEALVLPAASATAPRIGDELARDVLYRYFAPLNLSGAPAVSVPTRFDRRGLPTGM